MRSRLRRLLLAALLLAVVLAAGALLVAASGLVPIAASSGHGAISGWFLHFTMRQAVGMQSLGIRPPPLDDPALVVRGAGHYGLGCAPCHGGPGDERSPVVRQMTPEPPYLPPRIDQWQARELFWIVKHGIKFSGMPAWPARERDDEVWALVAFLQRLPGMSATEYRRLAGVRAGDAVSQEIAHPPGGPPESALRTCVRCHADDGAGRGDAFPRLNGQTEEYLYASLRAYARGERASGIMQPVAADLDDRAMRALARYYASRAARSSVSGGPDPEALARGEAIARRGLPDQGVPPCVSCHGPKAEPRHAGYPVLAGQYRDYLVQQLRLFAAGSRGGTPYAHLMRTIAQRLTEAQAHDVATYFASLEASTSSAR